MEEDVTFQEMSDAIRRNDIESLRTVLRRDPGVLDRKNDCGETALKFALCDRNECVARLILESGMETLLEKRNLPYLSLAVRQKMNSIAEEILERGANPNEPDKTGCLPLMHAILGRNMDAVRLLVAYGADPDKADADGTKPLGLIDATSKWMPVYEKAVAQGRLGKSGLPFVERLPQNDREAGYVTGEDSDGSKA